MYKSVTVDESGRFSVTVPMDVTRLEQKLTVYGENQLGTKTAEYGIYLTNEIMQAKDIELAIYLGGKDVTYKTISAGEGGKLELRAVSGDKTVVVPENSTLGSQAEWSVYMVGGNADIDNGQLTTDKDANGMLKVKLEDQDVSAVIGGYEVEGAVRKPVISPESREFTSSVDVTITCDTEGAQIYYTTDGTAPTTASTKYTGRFTVTNTTTVKAIAVLDGVYSGISSATYTKRSTGGTGGGGYVPSTPRNPSINGIEMSWSQIAAYIRNLTKGTEVTVQLNGNYDVPAIVMSAIDSNDIRTTFVVDTSRSWFVNGATIEAPASADLRIVTIAQLDTAALRGTAAVKFRLDGTNAPTELTVSFNHTQHNGRFANVYMKDGDSFVFVDNVIVDEKGRAKLLDLTETGEYVIMISDYSDRKGDVTNNGVTNALDAAAILKDIVGLEAAPNPSMRDYDENGSVNALDASAILIDIVNGRI